MLDIVVIGAGPAGLTAALYGGRSKLKTKLLEKNAVGGQVLLTEKIENFPGVYGMKVGDWLSECRKQLADLEDVSLEESVKVEQIKQEKDFFRVFTVSEITEKKQEYDTRGVVISVGAQPKRLGIPGENKLIGRGVSYCATCDGPLFKDKHVVVIGGGDTAIEEALYLRKVAKKVTIVHRRDALRAAAVLQEKVFADDKIEVKWDSIPVEIIGDMKVESLRLKNVKTLKEESLACDGVFIFVGFLPDTAFLKGFLDLNEQGRVITDENMMSSCIGVFAAGDCRARPLHQVVTACSDGAIAAFSINKFLENKI
ncbi:MAG: thioredoxin-disulfide reductase [Candidatus Omnitrophota bacterium]